MTVLSSVVQTVNKKCYGDSYQADGCLQWLEKRKIKSGSQDTMKSNKEDGEMNNSCPWTQVQVSLYMGPNVCACIWCYVWFVCSYTAILYNVYQGFYSLVMNFNRATISHLSIFFRTSELMDLFFEWMLQMFYSRCWYLFAEITQIRSFLEK